MAYDVAKNLLDLARTLLSIKDAVDKSDVERRARVADFLTSVAVAIDKMASVFEQGKVPSAECAEVRTYMTELGDIVGDYLAPGTLDHYQKVLSSAIIIRGALFLAEDAGSADNALAMLRSSAGQFRALGTTIKAR
jgi:hypothetical protein